MYFGTLADWQGIAILIQAMPHVLASHAAQLHILGRGRRRQRKLLDKSIRKMGLDSHISLLPAVPHHQVATLLETADVCVAPLALNDRNLVQGCCPMKVIEYMAAGRPVVAANLPVVRELLREDVHGLLFTAGDPHDLARQIVRLLGNHPLAARLASHAARHAHQHLTWRRAHNELVALYRRLADYT
jgi:glycosyltransferase involved in cell wall biosynthesis